MRALKTILSAALLSGCAVMENDLVTSCEKAIANKWSPKRYERGIFVYTSKTLPKLGDVQLFEHQVDFEYTVEGDRHRSTCKYVDEVSMLNSRGVHLDTSKIEVRF